MRLPVLDSWLHYSEHGAGPPVLFLHGNPTSSYLWRDVIGPVADAGYRCLALDLIGMGQSGKPDLGYRLVDHLRYVNAFLDALDLDDVTLVGHDWGAVIALDLLRTRPDQIVAVAFCEGHLHPIERWADLDAGGRELFGRLRTPGVGEQLVLEENFFVETVLPSGVLRRLTDDELDAYRAPYPDAASRRPLLQWPREIPIEGEPADVTAVVRTNQRTIAESSAPKLLLHGEPGAVVGAAEVAWCRAHGQNLDVVNVGRGSHFLPEDLPGPIAEALCGWLNRQFGHRGT
ncbi:haloalkane dehalogenase [Cryptosporangium aurantiacum]|uniref:haloalkane dehalogenase n=1 Tax=Cryptosporangium aurantiacum TaxID=134849 RepID=UPI001C4A4A94|nr:haloalkane dehalogenase [Cryptosporangium aurantiacum]